MLANRDISVPISRTGTGYIDSMMDKYATPKNPIVPIPIKMTEIKY